MPMSDVPWKDSWSTTGAPTTAALKRSVWPMIHEVMNPPYE